MGNFWRLSAVLVALVVTSPVGAQVGPGPAGGGGSSGVAQGSTTSGQIGPLIQGAVTTSAPSYTTGQTSPLSLDLAGNLRVNVVTGGAGGGAVYGPTAGGSAAANPPVLMGGVQTNSNTGLMQPWVINSSGYGLIDAPAGSNLANLAAAPLPVIAGTLPSTQAAVSTGVTTKLQTDLNGNAYISPQQAGGALLSTSDPCGPQNAKLGAPISLTASGQVITGTVSKKTYICSIDLISATAQNIALVEGTGTTCATNIFGLAGSTTAATGWNLAANGGLTKGAGIGTVYSPSADTNSTAANVCLLLSSTGQTSGQITYVQQ